MTSSKDFSISEEISRLETKAEKLKMSTYGKLAAQKFKLPSSWTPPFCDYIKGMITDFTPLAGDRCFGEDDALVGGLGRFNGRSVVVMGQEKGNDTTSRIKHNFGMARPERIPQSHPPDGYMASQFQLPVITLVDTAGAYPGVDAEAAAKPKPLPNPLTLACVCAPRSSLW